MKTTNLFTFLVLFIASVMFLTMPVSAVVYEGLVTDPLGLGYYADDTILVSEGSSPSNIVQFYHEGSGSTSTKIINIADYCESACIGYNGDIFFVLTDGRVYRFYGGAGIHSFTADYNTSFQLLADIDALSISRDIVIDSNSNLYVNSDDNVYILSYPSYSISLLTTVPTVASPDDNIASLGLHKDGLLIGQRGIWASTPQTLNVYLYNGTLNSIYGLTTSGTSGSHFNFNNIYSTSVGDVYVTYNAETQGIHKLYRLNYTDNYAVSTISTLAFSPSAEYIGNTGVLYLTSSSDDKIYTYSTIGAQGGYSYYYYEGSTGKQQLDYDVSLLNSLYATYNNDSNIELLYSIDIDLVQGLTTQDFYNENGNSQYYWVVDVLDTDGIKQKTTIINSFDKDYDIVSGWHIISIGNLQYSSSVWENGTWSAILYEYDTGTGLRAALDNCEFEIYNQVSDTTIIDETPGIDPTLNPISRIDALLESNAFIGLLIILACIGAFGKVGGVVGVVLGTVAGISLATLLGYIPGWIMFVMIMTLCVVFASKIVGQIGGGNE